LSRDPIEERGGINIYVVAGNDPQSDIDPLGLDANIAYNAFRDIRRDFADSLAAETTGYRNAMRKLAGTAPQISIEVGHPASGSTATYYPHSRIVVLPNPFKYDVLHEMVHAWNDHDPSGITEDRPDEGMAYGFEQGLYIGVWDIATTERSLRRSDKACDRDYFQKLWNIHWDTMARPEQYPGGRLSEGQRSPFKLNAFDFLFLKQKMGFKMSCDKFADVFNSILASKGCCFRFSCNYGDPDPSHIPPGQMIHPVFRL
jgi:hypothetical protein